LEVKRKHLWELAELKEGALFDEMDTDRKGWLSLNDFQNFMTQFYPNMNFAEIERAFRRVDEDNDDRVLFDEFVRTVRPVYCYRYYDHYIPTARDISSTKTYQPSHSPKPLRTSGKVTTSTKIQNLEKKAQRERTKDLVEQNISEQTGKKKTNDLYVSTSYGTQNCQTGEGISPSKVRSRGAMDPFNDYAYRGHYPDFQRNWQGVPSELEWGFGPQGMGMGTPFQNFKNPIMNKDWEYWKENPYINAAARRVEKSH